jgi:hypothetical protein
MRAALSTLIVLAAVAAVPTALGKPPGQPPVVKGAAVAPPPAWLQASGKALWMKFSSYCWHDSTGRGACVDMLPPQSRTDLPFFRVRAGTPLPFHLRFIPDVLHVTVYRRLGFKHYILPPRRDVTWAARGNGVVELEARSGRRSATYLVRLQTLP